MTVQQGGRGALVVIDDSGIGMEDDQLRRARRLLSGPSEVLLTELGNPPKAGFAVIGKLARQYGFTCHIEPSPYGGMRTIVRIPGALLTVVDEEQPLSVLTPLPVREPATALAPVRAVEPAPAPDPDPDPAGLPAGPDEDGLPSRRRRRALPQQSAAAAGPQPLAARTPEEASARWQALQDGTGSGRLAAAALDAAPADAGAPDASAAPHSPTPNTPEGADQ